MASFDPITFSESGLPELLEEEVVRVMQPYLAIKMDDHLIDQHDSKAKKTWKAIGGDKSGVVHVTNLRLLVLHEREPIGLGHSMEKLGSTEKGDKFFSRKSTLSISTVQGSIVEFIFESKVVRDAVAQAVEKSQEQKSWEKIREEKKRIEEEKKFTTSKAGVAGIMKKKEAEIQKREHMLDSAFADLDSLIDNAKELVRMAEQFGARQSKAQGEGSAMEQKESAQVQEYMLNMGIASPVTKSSAGSLYYVQLARQLSDFLSGALKAKGMLSLAVVYASYNRARGTDLVSPHDIFTAASLFEELQLPVRLRTLPSGSVVVQSIDFSDERVFQRILGFMKNNGPSTPVGVGKYLGCTVSLALELLKIAEEQGCLSRDMSSEGLVFWPNIFSAQYQVYLPQRYALA